MGRRGKNRDMRNQILAKLEEQKPEVYEELLALRSTNPAAYRKRLRYWVQYYPIEKPQKVMANRGARWHGSMLSGVEALSAPFQVFRHGLLLGRLDDCLDALEEKERVEKNRPVIFQLINERRQYLAAPPVQEPMSPPRSTWRRVKFTHVPSGIYAPNDILDPTSERYASWREGGNYDEKEEES